MAVTDDKIAHCVAHYREKLDSHPRTPESLSQAPDSRLHVIIELAGAGRRSQALLARLDQAFTDAGIVTYPLLRPSRSNFQTTTVSPSRTYSQEQIHQ